jgi:lysyl-tRNA synthetase, class II
MRGYIAIIGARIRFLTVRQSAALAVAVLAVDAVLSGVASDDGRHALLGGLVTPDLPSEVQVLSVMVGLALLAVAPRLWRGTRTAVPLATGGLLLLAVTSVVKGRWEAAGLEIGLAALITLGRRSFRIGCRNRPQLAVVCAAVGAWGLTYLALRLAPLVPSHGGHAFTGALRHFVVAHSVGGSVGGHLSEAWISVIEGLIAAAATISALALRSLLSPAPSANQHVEHEYRLARALLDCHGTDSLSPFILRPDKALHLGAGGVLSYRVIRGTAIVSSDPVAPEGAATDVLASFLTKARDRGWGVAVWAASGLHLEEYRRLGLHAICVGEEAFVDPRPFTLEGRPVRKLRQSVHRVRRRGWELSVHEGRAIDGALEAEIGALELAWRGRQRHLHGFAMGMGRFDAELRPDDLYVLARSPEGQLGAVMRFISHRGKLSLDTMRRVGATPNGLNEALVCSALEAARERDVPEVSLNYAGLAHLVHGEPISNPLARALMKLVMAPLGRRFQMERLVRFNEKFSPEWRPRFLIYESRGALPKAVLRVLQAEGYLPEPRRRRRRFLRLPPTPAVTSSPHAGHVG